MESEVFTVLMLDVQQKKKKFNIEKIYLLRVFCRRQKRKT